MIKLFDEVLYKHDYTIENFVYYGKCSHCNAPLIAIGLHEKIFMCCPTCGWYKLKETDGQYTTETIAADKAWSLTTKDILDFKRVFHTRKMKRIELRYDK